MISRQRFRPPKGAQYSSSLRSSDSTPAWIDANSSAISVYAVMAVECRALTGVTTWSFTTAEIPQLSAVPSLGTASIGEVIAPDCAPLPISSIPELSVPGWAQTPGAPAGRPDGASRVLVDAGSARRLARRVARGGLDMGSYCPGPDDPAMPSFRQVFHRNEPTRGWGMKKALIAVAICLSSTAIAVDADGPPVDVQDQGRFVFKQVGRMRADMFMIDTKTGRIWQIVENPETKSLSLSPVYYHSVNGRTLMPEDTLVGMLDELQVRRTQWPNMERMINVWIKSVLGLREEDGDRPVPPATPPQTKPTDPNAVKPFKP